MQEAGGHCGAEMTPHGDGGYGNFFNCFIFDSNAPWGTSMTIEIRIIKREPGNLKRPKDYSRFKASKKPKEIDMFKGLIGVG